MVQTPKIPPGASGTVSESPRNLVRPLPDSGSVSLLLHLSEHPPSLPGGAALVSVMHIIVRLGV